MNIWIAGGNMLTIGIIVGFIIFSAIYIWKCTHDD